MLIDYDRCLACGICIGLCKKKALSVGRHGFHVYIGGKGGRYPQNGELFASFVAEKEVLPYLQATLMTYQAVAKKGERLSAVVARLGLPAIKEKIRTKLAQG